VPLETILKDGVRGESADVSAMASEFGGKVYVFAWHYHDDDIAGPDAQVELKLTGVGNDQRAMRITQYRIDENHSNAYTLWKKFDSPQAPTPAQYEQLQQAGQLATVGQGDMVTLTNGAATLQFTLPRQAVALFVFERVA
jgi:xylan 1,4-beta-xylosidase